MTRAGVASGSLRSGSVSQLHQVWLGVAPRVEEAAEVRLARLISLPAIPPSQG